MEFVFNPDDVKILCDGCGEKCTDYRVMNDKVSCIVCVNNELENMKRAPLYKKGFDDGENHGYEKGYDDGYESGDVDGYIRGYENCRDELQDPSIQNLIEQFQEYVGSSEYLYRKLLDEIEQIWPVKLTG